MNSRRRTRKGQAMVEFTLVATVLVTLLQGIFQFGIAYSNSLSITDAAREGARRAVVNQSNGPTTMVSAGIAAARSSASQLDQSQLNVTVTSQNGTWTAGDPITVRVTYPYDISIIGLAVKSGTLTAETTMATN